MRAVHFGAGNIGRGFIAEVLVKNGFSVDFVDINETIINELQKRKIYEIELAAPEADRILIHDVNGINNGTHPDEVVAAIRDTDIITTAIGPNVLPHIAELIAQGIQSRRAANIEEPIDVIACENMIGGTDFLKEKIFDYLTAADQEYVEQYIGFPNAAVDRIVPDQSHADPLLVSVEPFKEWVIDQTNSKASHIHLDGVQYVENLEPYIERKLFSVNTGHATTAYAGAFYGYETIDEAIQDERVKSMLENVLSETSALIVDKWGFDAAEHKKYAEKIIARFENPNISDLITRVARTPLRKLGYDERFIRPIRESKEHGLSYAALVTVVGMIFHYDNPEDPESVELQEKLKSQPLEEVVRTVTGLTDEELIHDIVRAKEKLD